MCPLYIKTPFREVKQHSVWGIYGGFTSIPFSPATTIATRFEIRALKTRDMEYNEILNDLAGEDSDDTT